MNRTIRCVEQPRRIVSLVPSITELLHDLGLEQEVVGITRFCIHPSRWYREKKRVGGTKKVRHEVIQSLEPDLIIANKEENTQKDVEALAEHYPVWISDIYNMEDAMDMIQQVGYITGSKGEANRIAHQIELDLQTLPKIRHKPTVLYSIWRDPWMFAGNDVFINAMLQHAGFNNILSGHPLLKQLEAKRRNIRYPALSIEEIRSLQPEYVFLSSEPFPFRDQHIQEVQSILPQSTSLLVDGEIFTWYGSRLLQAADYFLKLRKKTLV